MPGPVNSRVQTIAGVNSSGVTKFVTNGNATDYLQVRLTDGSIFYTASGSSGGGATTINIGSFGGSAVILGNNSMAGSLPVTIASDQTPLAVNASQAGAWFTTSNVSNIVTVTGSNLTIAQMPTTNVSITGQPISTNATITGSNITISQLPTITNNLGSYGGVSTTLGQKSMAASMPVTIASDQSAVTIQGSNISIAQLPTGNVSITGQPISVNASQNGVWNIGTVTTVTNLQNATITSMPTTNVSVTGQPLTVNASQNGAWFTTSNVSNTVTVTGSALSIAQAPTTTVIQTIASNFKAQIDNSSWGGVSTTLGQKSMAASVPVTISSDQSAVTVSGSVTIGNVGPNFNITTNIGSYGGTASTLGQKTAALSIPVVLAAGQIYPVSQSGTWNIGTVTTVTGITNIVTTSDNVASYGGTAVTLGIKSMAASMPVVIASDQTPFGVNASQSGSWTVTENLNSWGGTATTLGQKSMAASVPVTISSDQSAVTFTGSNITIASMPTTNVSITAQPISTNLSAYGGTATTLGQKAMSASIPVVLASDQNINRMTTIQILAATTFNDTVSTATSSVANISQYRHWTLFYTLTKANAPTDILISPQFANDSALSTWGDIGYSYLQDLRFDDTAVGSGIKEVVTGDVLDNFFRCTVLATGTTSTATFTNTLSLGAWN